MVRHPFRHISSLIPVLNQVNVLPTPQPYFFEIHFIIILPWTPGPSRRSFSFRFPTKYPCAFVFSSRHTTCSSALTLVDLSTLVTIGEECKSSNITSHYFFQPPLTVSSSIPNIHLSTLFSKNRCRCPSLNTRNQEKTRKFLVLLALIFMILRQWRNRQWTEC